MYNYEENIDYKWWCIWGQALLRECKEELGIEINDDDIKYIRVISNT